MTEIPEKVATTAVCFKLVCLLNYAFVHHAKDKIKLTY